MKLKRRYRFGLCYGILGLHSTVHHHRDEIGHYVACSTAAAAAALQLICGHPDVIQKMDRAAATPLSHDDSTGVTSSSLDASRLVMCGLNPVKQSPHIAIE